MESFVVRIWVPADGVAPDTDLRGLVRRIATGEEMPFRGNQEVLRILRGVMGSTREPPNGSIDPLPHAARSAH